jgi:hypothetical protein
MQQEDVVVVLSLTVRCDMFEYTCMTVTTVGEIELTTLDDELYLFNVFISVIHMYLITIDVIPLFGIGDV